MPTNVFIPITEGTTTTACSDESHMTNDQICTTEQTNQQETVVQQQNTVTPQVTQPVHTGYLENSLNTISTQDNDINDHSSSGTILIQTIKILLQIMKIKQLAVHCICGSSSYRFIITSQCFCYLF